MTEYRTSLNPTTHTSWSEPHPQWLNLANMDPSPNWSFAGICFTRKNCTCKYTCYPSTKPFPGYDSLSIRTLSLHFGHLHILCRLTSNLRLVVSFLVRTSLTKARFSLESVAGIIMVLRGAIIGREGLEFRGSAITVMDKKWFPLWRGEMKIKRDTIKCDPSPHKKFGLQ